MFQCHSHDFEFNNLEELSVHYSTKPPEFCQPCAMHEHYKRLKPASSICLLGKNRGCSINGSEPGKDGVSESSQKIRFRPRQNMESASGKPQPIPDVDAEIQTVIEGVSDFQVSPNDAGENEAIESQSPSLAPHVEASATPIEPFSRSLSPESANGQVAENEDSDEEESAADSEDEEECMPNDGQELLSEPDCQDLCDHGEHWYRACELHITYLLFHRVGQYASFGSRRAADRTFESVWSLGAHRLDRVSDSIFAGIGRAEQS